MNTKEQAIELLREYARVDSIYRSSDFYSPQSIKAARRVHAIESELCEIGRKLLSDEDGGEDG